VYDGSAWVEQTVVDHGQLSGVGAGDHHTRYTDAEAAGAALQYVALFQGTNAHKQRYTYDTSDLGSATIEYRCDPNGSAGFTVYENGSQVADAFSSSGTNTTISTSFTPSSGVNSYTLSINRPDNGGAEYWFGGWLEP